MTVLELHHRAMELADIGDQLARKDDHARAARFYGYAARRELKAAALTEGVQPSYRILMASAASLIGNVVDRMEGEDEQKAEAKSDSRQLVQP